MGGVVAAVALVALCGGPSALGAHASTVLLGGQTVGSHQSDLRAGRLEAFRVRTRASGVAGAVQVYVDRGSTVRALAVGIYSDIRGRPGALLTQGSRLSRAVHGWRTVAIAPAILTSGKTYWLAVLGGGGTLRYRSPAGRVCAGALRLHAYVRRLPARLRASKVHTIVRCPISADVLAARAASLKNPPADTSPPPSSPATPAILAPAGQPAARVPPVETRPPEEESSPPEEPPPPPPPGAPTNTALPSVVGKAVEGETLQATAGSWTGQPTAYAYQWEDCNTSGKSCSSIGGATGAAYGIGSGDVGHRLLVVVTATNAEGSTKAASAATSTVLPPAPANTAPPSVVGKTVEGETLQATAGSWSNDPASYAYQWKDCDVLGGGCMPVSGATSSGYQLTPSDVGSTMRVVVTATNAGGSTPASSEATSEVLARPPLPPVDLAKPKISGAAEEGKTLKASTGTWTEAPTSYAYQWELCSSSGGGCANIAQATSNTLGLTADEVGHKLRVVVHATNAGGTGEATSQATATVVAVGGTKTGCFEQPIVDVEGVESGEGTERMTKCGYPTPENVGAEREGKKCSEKEEVPGNKTLSTEGETIENKDIAGWVIITADHVTLRNDCIIFNGETSSGGEGPAMENQANYFTMEDSTLRGPNSTTGSFDYGFKDEGNGTTGVLLKKDVIEDCGNGGCIHGGAVTKTNPEKTFELVESYVFPNQWMGRKATTEHDVHRENWYINQGRAVAKDDTLLNPENSVAIIFGETVPNTENDLEFVVENSLIGGSGQSFQEGKNTTGVNAAGFIFRNDRFARCLTEPLAENNQKCSGEGYLGADSHGYFPHGPWLGDIVTAEPAPFEQGVWEGNYWDDNLEAAAE